MVLMILITFVVAAIKVTTGVTILKYIKLLYTNGLLLNNKYLCLPVYDEQIY